MISWNVRGLNDPQKRLVMKNLLRYWKSDVVCVEETKLVGVKGALDKLEDLVGTFSASIQWQG